MQYRKVPQNRKTIEMQEFFIFKLLFFKPNTKLDVQVF